MMQAVCWRRPTSAPAGGNRTTPTDEMTLAADLYAVLQVGPVLPMPRPWLSRCWMSVMLCSAGLVDGWLQCKSSSHYEDGMNQTPSLGGTRQSTRGDEGSLQQSHMQGSRASRQQ